MKERTFIAIKPDGVQRGIIGEVIKRFETKGFKLVGMRMVHVSMRRVFFALASVAVLSAAANVHRSSGAVKNIR